MSLVVGSACGSQPLSTPAATSAPARTTPATVTATRSAPSAAPSPTAAARYELVADIQGTTGPAGLLPAGGELSCRGRVFLTIDMRPKPPLGLVTAYFDIEMESCPEGTALTDGHVHQNVPGHQDRIYIAAGITRPIALPGGAGLVTTTYGGVDPRAAAEVVAEPERFMFGLHTERNPVGGAGRGVLRRR